MSKQHAIHLALIGLFAAGAVGTAGTAQAAGAHNMVKCYGVNAAYKNDCASPGHSCAGQDTKARDPNAFVAVPKGLCQKLAGGSLKPADAMGKGGSMHGGAMHK